MVVVVRTGEEARHARHRRPRRHHRVRRGARRDAVSGPSTWWPATTSSPRTCSRKHWSWSVRSAARTRHARQAPRVR